MCWRRSCSRTGPAPATGTPTMWDQRYGGDAYFYGTEPNDFLREQAAVLPPGRALCLAEGEGRNAVHLAQLGHAVLAQDLSSVGLAKARQLAAQIGRAHV